MKVAVKVYELFDTLYLNEDDPMMLAIEKDWRHKERVEVAYVSMCIDDWETLNESEGKCMVMDRGMTLFDSMSEAMDDVKDWNAG